VVSDSNVEISLVICTRNRAPQLPAALEALARVECPHRWELVLVDNASTDETPQLLTAFQKKFKGSLQVLRAPVPGLARARNVGWRAANGRIIAFTDDDCYPQPDFLTETLACFSEEKFGFAGGRVLLHDPLDYPITIQLSQERHEFRPRSYIPPGRIHGANFAFRRDALLRIGGFDERLGAGTALCCAEDTDALARVSANGWWGVYDVGPTVSHHHRRRDPREIEKMRKGHSIGTGAYFLKCCLDPRVTLQYAIHWLPSIWYAGLSRSRWHLLGMWRFAVVSVSRASK
jgi:glycosyltransferase involved in cell wall biosynthesis